MVLNHPPEKKGKTVGKRGPGPGPGGPGKTGPKSAGPGPQGANMAMDIPGDPPAPAKDLSGRRIMKSDQERQPYTFQEFLRFFKDQVYAETEWLKASPESASNPSKGGGTKGKGVRSGPKGVAFAPAKAPEWKHTGRPLAEIGRAHV